MSIILSGLKERKYKIQALVFFLLLMLIYFLLDYLNMPYPSMKSEYGIYLVLINILLNIIMAGFSSILIVASEMMVKATKASSLGFWAIIFGLFTYGCTTCLIALFTNIGIVLFVIVLPFAGLPYKLISLVLILLGMYLTLRQFKKGCKVKINHEQE